jgi:hypothetical protein
MRSTIWILLLAVSTCVPCSYSQAQEDPVSNDAQERKAEASYDADSTPSDGGTPGAQGERWRYKQHDGLWWYWLPSNNWVYWTDGKWVPYDAKSYAEFKAARSPRVYSAPGRGGGNSGDNYPGNWGPMRYNQYGQRQYPYSQRNSGIRQLGPVPAPGGVRSLPGWGGER